MESHLLQAAKRYQKEHKWEKAIDSFEKYINEYEGNCADTVYTSYAKCLRVIGNTNHAEEVLERSQEFHPQSERVLLEFYNIYDSLADWNAALSVVYRLIEINPEEAGYHFRLGKTYASKLDYNKAEQAYQTGLKWKHGLSFEELITKIKEGFTDTPDDFSSQYIFINGKNNLGAFTHTYGDRKYITKISRYKRDAKREEKFYKNVCLDFPALKSVVPLCIDSQVFDNILYLTLEMIDDVPVTSEHIKDIIATSSTISSVTYEDVKEYSNPKYLFQLRNRPGSVTVFFTQIHKKYYNERLFASLHKLSEQKNYSETLNQVIRQLESLVMENDLYTFMEPEKHYTLLHGDFNTQNIKINKLDKIPRVFDWATFKIGPHFIDIARYLSISFTPYSEVKEVYLFNDETGWKLTMIEKIFFLYGLILYYILYAGKKKSMETRLSDYILPALIDFESLVAAFVKVEYNQTIQSLFAVDVQHRIIQREQNKTSSTKKKIKLHEQIDNIFGSKSWIIKAPLRKLLHWVEKMK